MTEFGQEFLRERLTQGTAADGRAVAFALLGKYPAWGDYVSEGTPTRSMAIAFRAIHASIEGQFESPDSISAMNKDVLLFDDILLWIRGDQALACLMWDSRDAVGRRFPAVALAHCSGFSIEVLPRKIFGRLREFRDECAALAADFQNQTPPDQARLVGRVTAEIVAAQADFAALTSKTREMSASEDYPGRDMAKRFVTGVDPGPETERLVRILYEYRRRCASYRAGAPKNEMEGALQYPERLRLPVAPVASIEAMVLWHRLLFAHLDSIVPVLQYASPRNDWIGAIVGEPRLSDVLRLRIPWTEALAGDDVAERVPSVFRQHALLSIEKLTAGQVCPSPFLVDLSTAKSPAPLPPPEPEPSSPDSQIQIIPEAHAAIDTDFRRPASITVEQVAEEANPAMDAPVDSSSNAGRNRLLMGILIILLLVTGWIMIENPPPWDVTIPGSKMSSKAALAGLGPPPVIVEGTPADLWLEAGQTAALGVQVRSTGAVEYAWFQAPAMRRISAKRTLDVSASSARVGELIRYAAIVRNEFGSATSRWSTVSIVPTVTIARSPSAERVPDGTPVNLEARLNRPIDLRYQWFHQGLPISGATARTWKIARLGMQTAGDYHVTIQADGWSRTSAVCRVSRFAVPTNQPPEIRPLTPPIVKALKGADVTLVAEVIRGSPASMQWLYQDVPIVGSNAVTLRLASVTQSNSGYYSLVASNSGGMITSRVAEVRVTLPQPEIDRLPVAIAINVGAVTNIEAIAKHATAVTWMLNGKSVATGPMLHLEPRSTNDSGRYSIVAANVDYPAGVTSHVFVVVSDVPEPKTVAIVAPQNVPPTAPVTTLVPTPARTQFHVLVGRPISLRSTLPERAGLVWTKNGVNLEGAMTPHLELPAADPSSDGVYRVSTLDREVSEEFRVWVQRTNALGMTFIWVPGVPNTQGGAWIGKYEVTQPEFDVVMGTNHFMHPRGPSNPADSVSLDDAIEFCRRMNEMEREGARYAVPTEDQWEFFARDTDLKDAITSREAESARSKPERVGSRAPNPQGLFDVRGNLWEWCNTKASDEKWVCRGGDYSGKNARPVFNLEMNYRYLVGRTARVRLIGFRCLMTFKS